MWKYHYTPGMHENATIGELLINGDVWKSLSPQHQEIIKSAANETFLLWWAKWQTQNADALKEMQEKHGVQILRTPPDILIEFLKTWDEIAKEESAKNPFFKKVLESQRAYASIVVPAKRFMFPPYSFAANYYLPEKSRPRQGGARLRRRSSGRIARAARPRLNGPRPVARAAGRLFRRPALTGRTRRMVEPSPGLHQRSSARSTGSPTRPGSGSRGSACRWCWRSATR